jgi:hypothetical protein
VAEREKSSLQPVCPLNTVLSQNKAANWKRVVRACHASKQEPLKNFFPQKSFEVPKEERFHDTELTEFT